MYNTTEPRYAENHQNFSTKIFITLNVGYGIYDTLESSFDTFKEQKKI